MLMNVILVTRESFLHLLPDIRGGPFSLFINICAIFSDEVANIHYQMEPIDAVHDTHIEWRRNGPFFLVPSDVKVVILAMVRQFLDQFRIRVKVEENWLVLREN